MIIKVGEHKAADFYFDYNTMIFIYNHIYFLMDFLYAVDKNS